MQPPDQPPEYDDWDEEDEALLDRIVEQLRNTPPQPMPPDYGGPVMPMRPRRRFPGASIPAPLSYRRWDGAPDALPDAFAGDWPWPRMVESEGSWWLELLAHDSRDWMHLGHVPAPKGRWERFWHNWHHGRLMCCRPIDVLAFALQSAFRRWPSDRLPALRRRWWGVEE